MNQQKTSEYMDYEMAVTLQKTCFSDREKKPSAPTRISEVTPTAKRRIKRGHKKVKVATSEMLITYDGLRRGLHKTLKGRVKGPLKFTDDQTKIIRQLVRYFTGDPNSELDPDKSIYLYGSYGTGKTTLLRSILSLLHDADRRGYSNSYSCEMLDYKELIYKIKSKGDSSIITNYDNVMIDDLGYTEQSEINIYGNSEDLVTSIIYNRHKKRRRLKTHITSNLSPEKLLKSHGEGTYSRLVEMCNIIFYQSENLRLKK